MAKQRLARPPAAVSPPASPAAGSETAAVALPAAYALLSYFGPARPAPAARPLHAKRWGSAQPQAQSTRLVFLLVQISMGLLAQILMEKLPKRPRVGIPRG